MSILGMGSLELVVVLLLAFIILGPERMVDAARKLGKLTGELRRMTSEVTDMVQEEVDRVKDPIIREGRELESRVTSVTSGLSDNAPDGAQEDGEGAEDGPVSFKSARQAALDKQATLEKKETDEETSRETERKS